jgi:hypothetical protein
MPKRQALASIVTKYCFRFLCCSYITYSLDLTTVRMLRASLVCTCFGELSTDTTTGDIDICFLLCPLLVWRAPILPSLSASESRAR